MKARLIVTLMMAGILATTGCAATKPAADAGFPATMDGSSTAVDWPGVYRGVTPCADCEGIETTVTLNSDLTYAVTTRYLGRDAQVFEKQGAFSWDETGGIVRLQGLDDGPSSYRVGENVLFQLDRQGQRITGDLADRYLLTKDRAAPEALVAPRTWRLVELRGKPVKAPADRKAPFLVFAGEGNRVNGFGGCNTFFGGVEYLPGDRIRFSAMGATKMFCPDLEIESAFLEALESADNYTTDGSILKLHKAKMAPLAVFEAGDGASP